MCGAPWSMILAAVLLLALSGLHQDNRIGMSAQAAEAVEAFEDGMPICEAPETAHDFGQISLDRDYEYGFTVRNVGTAPLEITKVIVG